SSASWEKVLLVLSLENAVRFWPEMGLPGSCAEMRMIAESCRSRFEEADVNEDLGEDEKADLLAKLLRSALAQVAASCGDEVVDELMSWARTIFPTNRQLITQPFLWTQVLRNAGRQGDESFVRLNVSSDKKAGVLAIVVKEIVNQRDIHEEVRRVEAEPRNAWDTLKFAEYAEGASPLDMVKEAVLRWRFVRAWRKIGSLLNQSDLGELLSWTRAEAAQM